MLLGSSFLPVFILHARNHSWALEMFLETMADQVLRTSDPPLLSVTLGLAGARLTLVHQMVHSGPECCLTC